MDNTKPYEGIKELLLNLKGKYQLVILTNKNEKYAKNLINRYFDGVFALIQGSYIDKPRKPNPYLANQVFEKLNINPNEAIYIGDTEIDFETGTNAGLKTILVSYGFRSRVQLEKTLQKVDIVDNPRDLEIKIKQILN